MAGVDGGPMRDLVCQPAGEGNWLVCAVGRCAVGQVIASRFIRQDRIPLRQRPLLRELVVALRSPRQQRLVHVQRPIARRVFQHDGANQREGAVIAKTVNVRVPKAAGPAVIPEDRQVASIGGQRVRQRHAHLGMAAGDGWVTLTVSNGGIQHLAAPVTRW